MKFYMVCWRGIDSWCPCWIEDDGQHVNADDNDANSHKMEVFLSFQEADDFLEACLTIDGHHRSPEFMIIEEEA